MGARENRRPPSGQEAGELIRHNGFRLVMTLFVAWIAFITFLIWKG